MMNLFKGVVESRADPLEIGRCKVRVIGVHTEDTALLPTSDLPWAMPMGDITSASISGFGRSPTGVLEGTWVWVFFSDGESKQQPVMMGTVVGIPETQEQELSDKQSSTSGTKYEGLSDFPESNNSAFNENSVSNNKQRNKTNGEQVLTQGDSDKIIKTTPDGSYKLGQVSKQYESGSSGAATVSSGKGDRGGVSYGTHQLASFRNPDGSAKSDGASNSPVQSFISGSSYKDDFKGLVPGSKPFSDKWKEVAARDPQGFENAQYEYFKSEYYNNGSNNIKSGGIDLSDRGQAVQESIWSTSVQYGTGGARKVYVRALDGKDIASMSDAEIIEAVQNDKLANVENDFKSSPELHSNLKNRIKNEKNDLIAMAGDDGKVEKQQNNNKDENLLTQTEQQNDSGIPSNVSSNEGTTKSDYSEDSVYQPPRNATPVSGVVVPSTTKKNSGKVGFSDPNKKYPLKDWLNESDTHRLARNGKIDKTIIKKKENSLIKNVHSAGGVRWNEPKSPYDAKYPLNHVYYSESGHAMEFDDTPDAERVHIYHRSGSFVEMHPDGTVVVKNVKDSYDVTVQHKNVYVGGTCNITVAGDTNVYTKGVMKVESDGDMHIKTKSNLKIGAMGTMHIESNGEMFVGSQRNLNQAGSNILLNCAWTAGSVNAGGYDAGEIAVEMMDDVVNIVPENEESVAIEQLIKTGAVDKPNQGENGTSAPVAGETPQTPNEPPKENENKGEEMKCEGCCDFTAEDLKSNLKLSNNFTLSDLTTSAHYPHALREQGGNDKLTIAKNLCAIANNVLEPIVAQYGRSSFIITSGFRAGSGSSQHLKGEAVDIQFVGLPHANAAQRAKDIAALVKHDQIILEWHGRNPVFHISYGSRMRGQQLTTPDLRNYFAGLRGKDMKLA